jgi:hypothetical protein
MRQVVFGRAHAGCSNVEILIPHCHTLEGHAMIKIHQNPPRIPTADSMFPR